MFETIKAYRIMKPIAVALHKAEQAETETAPTAAPAAGFTVAMSQARIFATERAKNAGREMLKVITGIQTRAGRITRLALAASMPHQIGYILSQSQSYIHFNSVGAVLEAITTIALTIIVPVVVDLSILNSIEAIGAVALDRRDKRRAMWLLIPLAGVSGYVNFCAPGPLIVKCLAAFVVACVPMNVVLKFVRVDWKAMERMELEATAGLAPVAVPVEDVPRPSAIGDKIRETREFVATLDAPQRAYYKGLKQHKKAAYLDKIRQQRASVLAQQISEAVDEAMGEAPVSPAPAGR